jgi:transposase InsO family protein
VGASSNRACGTSPIVAMGKARSSSLGHHSTDGTTAADHLPIGTEGYGPLAKRRIVVVSTWGLDLVGSFKKAKGGFTHIFVAVDKFTKWIEAKLATSITAAKVMEYIKEIIYKFGVRNNIITGNRTQFTAREFKEFCADLGIKISYAPVSHPQSNGQVECSNGMILQGLKPRIFDRLKSYAGKWVNELPSILWALRTTPSHATDQTLFSLVYGSEAMLPTKVDHKSFRVQQFNDEQSDDSRVDVLTRLEELCEPAVIRSAKHQ